MLLRLAALKALGVGFGRWWRDGVWGDLCVGLWEYCWVERWLKPTGVQIGDHTMCSMSAQWGLIVVRVRFTREERLIVRKLTWRNWI